MSSRRKRSAPARADELILGSSIKKPLALLLEAYDLAHGAGVDLWQLALELDMLLQAGLTTAELRFLVIKRYILHAPETTRPRSRRRSYGPAGPATFTSRTCVILTDAGATLARQVLRKREQPKRPRSVTAAPSHPSLPTPTWDKVTRQLRVGGLLVKAFLQPAPSQETLLASLEEQGWPPEVDDPLPHMPAINPKRRLHDTINSLNRRQRHRLLHFSSAGNGTRIRWHLLPQPSSTTAPPQLHPRGA
jgi:hypothetical protein